MPWSLGRISRNRLRQHYSTDHKCSCDTSEPTGRASGERGISAVAGGGARLLALPERKVWWSEENYLTFFDRQKPGEIVDQGRFFAVASLPINSLTPRSIVLTPNGADAIALFSVSASAWDGHLVRSPSVRVVERWNLATHTALVAHPPCHAECARRRDVD